jgi:hypothetical protein
MCSSSKSRVRRYYYADLAVALLSSVLGYVSLVVTIGIIIYNVYEAENPTHVLGNTHKGDASPQGRMASIL